MALIDETTVWNATFINQKLKEMYYRIYGDV